MVQSYREMASRLGLTYARGALSLTERLFLTWFVQESDNPAKRGIKWKGRPVPDPDSNSLKIQTMPTVTRLTRTPIEEKSGDRLANAWIFIICAASFAWVRLIGQLYIVEPLLILVAFGAWSQGLYRSIPGRRTISRASKLLLLWLAGAVVSDVVHGSSFSNTARGWALVIFTLSNLLGLWVLTAGRLIRVVWAYIGLIASGVLGFFLEPNIYSRSIPWKFGFAYPLTLGIALIACSPGIRKRASASAAILALAGATNLVFGARSLAMVTFTASVFTLIASRRRRAPNGNWVLAASIILAVIAVSLLTTIYGHLAISGQFGAQEKQKYISQSEGRLGLLIGGRQESAFSIRAISESPIIGHGSFAPITPDLLSSGVEFLRANGYSVDSVAVEAQNTIPTHSALFQGWVAHGIAGAIFWIWLLFVAASGIASSLKNPNPLSPLTFYVGTLLVWDIFFSPYAAESRLSVPLALILLTLSHTRKSQST
jgi:hypothetical protein